MPSRRAPLPASFLTRIVGVLLFVLYGPVSLAAPSDHREVAPGLELPAGVTLPFAEDELLNDDAARRLAASNLTSLVRARVLLSQGMVGKAIDTLATTLPATPGGETNTPDDGLLLAAAYQQAGRLREALAWARSVSLEVQQKHKTFLVHLENGQHEVDYNLGSVIDRLKTDPTSAEDWAQLSRQWLSPSLQVRRNALWAAAAAMHLDPNLPSAREAMAEALAAYAFTTWTMRSTAGSLESGYRQSVCRPPAALVRSLIQRIDELATTGSMLAKLKDLYLVARQDPGQQREGIRLELAALRTTPPLDDLRYETYVHAVELWAAETSTGTWEHYKALDRNRDIQHYFQPLRIAARPVQLVLYDLAKSSLDDHVEAIKNISDLELPAEGDLVYWEGWRWLARGIAVSRNALGYLPPETIEKALSHLEKAQENHEADGAYLGAIGEAWFAGYRMLTENTRAEASARFLTRSRTVLDAAAGAGIDVDIGVVRAAALRAVNEPELALRAIRGLTDPGLPTAPTTEDRVRTAVQWLKVGLLYVDFRPSAEFKTVARNCFDRAEKLFPDARYQPLVQACRSLAGFADRTNLIVASDAALLKLAPPFGVELYSRLAERDTKLAYLELVRGKDLPGDAAGYDTAATDPGYHARVPLEIMALQMESLVASPEGFPANTSLPQTGARTTRAFAGVKASLAALERLKAIKKDASVTGIEARALESTLAESSVALVATVNRLHQAMSTGAVTKTFADTHGNNTVGGGLHPQLRLVDDQGNERKDRPALQVQTSWQDFVVSLAVGYLKWSADRARISDATLGLDDLKQQVRDVTNLRIGRNPEIKVAAERFDTVMNGLLKAERDRLAAEEARKREAAERYARTHPTDPPGVYTVRDDDGNVIGGLDFRVSATPTPRPYEAPTYEKPVERITCDVCRGSGVTYTQTSYSNSARQTCWRCKGKGWRSPHDM